MKESSSARFHTKAAAKYDNSYTDERWKIHGAVLDAKLDEFLPKRPSKILDAGGGTGNFAIRMAKLGHDVTLTDISAGMLAQAKKKIKKEELDIRVLRLDITNMRKLETSTFDFTASLGDPVSYCKDPRKAIAELARVTKRNRYVFITVDSFFRVMGMLFAAGRLKELERLERTGTTNYPISFPQHNFRVAELHQLFLANRLRVMDTFGLLGIINKTDEKVRDRRLRSRRFFNWAMRMEMMYANEPSIVGTANHIGIVGKKY